MNIPIRLRAGKTHVFSHRLHAGPLRLPPFFLCLLCMLFPAGIHAFDIPPDPAVWNAPFALKSAEDPDGTKYLALRIPTAPTAELYSSAKGLRAEKFNRIRVRFRLTRPMYNLYFRFHFIKDSPIVSMENQLFRRPLSAGHWHDTVLYLPGDASNLHRVSVILRNEHDDTGEAEMGLDLAKIDFFYEETPPDVMRKRSEWNEFLRTFRPEIPEDFSEFLNPPREHRFPAPLPLVRNGKPCAVIRYDASFCATPCVETAARELREHIRLVTGAAVPVNKPLAGKQNPETILILGNSPGIQDGYGAEWETLSGTDGFAIRREGNTLRVFGQTEKGTLNGVYALLENNTDLIWARPNKEFGTVYTRRKNFSLVWGEDVLEKPVTRYRGWGAFDGLEWHARNRLNALTGGGGDNYWTYANARTYGPLDFAYRGGHNICEYLPEPRDRFFAVVNGKRGKRGDNLCFSTPGLSEALAEGILRAAREAPQDVQEIQISLDDTRLQCECAECRKDIVPPDGKRIRYGEDGFLSNKVFPVLNHAASVLRKEFPRFRLRTNAYFQTLCPPECALAENLVVAFAAYPQADDKNPMFMESDFRFTEAMRKWAERLPRKQLRMRGYCGLDMAFPCPKAHSRKWDFREAARCLDSLSGENPIVWGDIPDRPGRYAASVDAWDVSAMEFWVMSRLMWNPEQDVETLYRIYCARAYREAAKPMFSFFAVLRKEFYGSSASTHIGNGPEYMVKTFYAKPEIREKLAAYLAEARKIVRHPAARILVERFAVRMEMFFHAYGGAAPAMPSRTELEPLNEF